MERVQTQSDFHARLRIRTSLDESLIVEAAAGTGKTSELVGRIVAVLQTGRARVERIVAVTFTRKAAGELKLRLRQELDHSRMRSQSMEERARLEQAIVRLEEAHIGTIHGFCADLLRERPVEAGIQPDFEEIDEQEAGELFQQVFRKWVEDALADPPPGLRRALDRATTWDRTRTPLDQIRAAAWELVQWRDFPSPWRREPFDREPELDRIVEIIDRLAVMARDCPRTQDTLRQDLTPVVDLRNQIERREAVRHRDYDRLESLVVKLNWTLKHKKRKGRGPFSERFSREEVLQARQTLLEALQDFQRRADAELAALLRGELWDLVQRYDQAKLDRGQLDFVDLLIAARNLVRGNRTVREFLQRRFTHLFVDEFQDTDPLQAELLLLLAADNPGEDDWRDTRPLPGKLFLVGDPKQSIYRFRRADVVLYQQLRDTLKSRGAGVVYLKRSFRAVPDIQNVINVAFDTQMKESRTTGQPSYVPLEPHRPALENQPAVIALPVARPYGWGQITKTAINQCLPDTVAAFVRWLLDASDWKVRIPGSDRIAPIAPNHICILFRRFLSWGRDVTREYVHALEGRGVPHVLWGAKSFHQREEVETIRAALTAIEWPDDELSVFATLKGSLFAISDDRLLRYRKEVGRLHPFGVPERLSADYSEIGKALTILQELHRGRNWRPFAETLHALLESTRAVAGFALRPSGHQVLANVYRMGDLARNFEARGGTSFRAFVDRLRTEAETPGTIESPILEDGAEGVRIMTVHAAKGLEFPVVILADITANTAPARPSRHVDPERGIAATRLLGCTPLELLEHEAIEQQRDEAEGFRVAYVAATRARDLLIVPAIGDRPQPGWVSVLNPALYPDSGRARHARKAPGCPDFGSNSVLERPPDQMGLEETSVRPGWHPSPSGDWGVVWWDPALLKLDAPGDFGIRQEDILRSDEDPDGAAQSIRQYAAWSRARTNTIERGRIPSCEILTPSQAEEGPPAELARIEWIVLERDPERPSGPRFGTLVHAVLGDVPLDAGDGLIGSLSRLHGRALDATEAEQSAAAAAVRRVLGHRILQSARRAERCHREYPLTVTLGEHRLLEGIVDLAFLEEGIWNVVDFKTDLDLATRPTHYAVQVNWYRYALTQVTGLPTHGYVLGV